MARTSELRDRVRRDVDEFVSHGGRLAEQVEGDGGRERVADVWLSYDLLAALRAVDLRRYSARESDSEQYVQALALARQEVRRARGALRDLGDALRWLAYLQRTGRGRG
jgi:hypothetical protein